MPNEIEQPVTGSEPTTPTATVKNPTATPGATPTIHADTAARIADLERDLASANTQIGTLNKENTKYRLLNKACETLGVTPENLRAKLEADKATIEGYAALGTTEELTAKIQRAKRADELERDNVLSKAGIDPKKFSNLKGSDDWTFETREEERDGKKIEVPYGKVGDVEKPLAELVTEKFPEWADSLKVNAVVQEQQPDTRNGGAWIAQGVQGNGPVNNSQPLPKPAVYSM